MLQSTKKISSPPKHVETSIDPGFIRFAGSAHGSERYLDVRYMKSLMHFKKALGTADCNASDCPLLRQRLYKHMMQSGHAIPENANDQWSSPDSSDRPLQNQHQSVFVAPSFSSLEVTMPNMPKHDGHASQTLASTGMDLFKPVYDTSINTDFHNKVDTSTETATVMPQSSVYRERLVTIITDWVRDLPTIRHLNTRDIEIKDNVTNDLIEYIFGLANHSYQCGYEENVKSQVDEFLKMFPGNLHNELEVTEGLKNKLWTQIQYLNGKYLMNPQEKYRMNEQVMTTDDNSTDHQLFTANKGQNSKDYNFFYESCFEDEIFSWLNTHINNKNLNEIHIAELLIRRLEPLLFSESMFSPKYKLILKGEIFGVLHDLSFFAQDEGNRIIYLNKCAEDLANKLLSIRINYDYPHFNKLESLSNTLPNSMNSNINSPLFILENSKSLELENIEEEHSGRYIENNYYSNCAPDHIVKDVIQQVSGTFIPELTNVISIYTSHTPPVTSTPKKAVSKNIPKLNAEETAYMENVAGLIRKWMETLPKKYDDDKNYKNTIIYDLAGDIMDDVKLKQLAPGTIKDDDKQWIYLIRRWLYRFSLFEDLRDSKIVPLIDDFISNLKKIPSPKLTIPQHGSRQAMQNIKHMHSKMWQEDFVPQGIDVLEDQISVWINDQPSDVFENKNRNTRNKLVHDLALNLQDRLRNKSPDCEMINDIQQWLSQIINPKEREHIGLLSLNLQERIKHTPQDETLGRLAQEQQRYRRDCLEMKYNPPVAPIQQDIMENDQDSDKTIKDFINKFMDYNYDIDDPLARGAFGHSLKKEIRKLSPLTRKEVYENLGKSTNDPNFPRETLSTELEYIKIISDWLKNIPVIASYNTVGNRRRIDFISDLAKNIAEIEDKRRQDSTCMNYDVYIESLISDSIWMYELPILEEYKKNKKDMVNQLLIKIIESRPLVNAVREEHDSSIIDDAGNVDILDIGKFIEEYVRINAGEIGDDELKAQAWSARLLKEIKKIVHNNDSPNTLNKLDMYHKFADVPVPGDESVKHFQLELDYIKEISEWLKNLPLAPISSQESQQERVEMISDLAEKMLERKNITLASPTDKNIDEKAIEYIKAWISRLPLYQAQDVVNPIVIQQLFKRIDNISDINQQDKSERPQRSMKSLTSTSNIKPIPEKQPCCSEIKSLPDPGKHIVNSIENWCKALPIEGEKEFVKTMKDNIAKTIYQKISALNVDPQIFNDNLMYQRMLEDEIDTQFGNLPQTSELRNKRESLKNELINTVLKAKSIAQAKSAGENYKHKLETTIDASIPNPSHSNQNVDPGFELYKSHLADIFILENFDQGNDSIKMTYENHIRAEIDKYFKNALERNAVPLSKEEIYNNLYGALFKVPIPCKNIMADEVEKIKTRCEIETWFEELPLREAEGLHELLEWEKIVEVLSKRLYDIEKTETKPAEKIHREITKWLNQLPLLDDEQHNIDAYAKKLQEKLKATASKRKCVLNEPKTKDKTKIKKTKTVSETLKKTDTNRTNNKVISPDSLKSCCNTSESLKKPADCIIDLVEEWCENLPLIAETEEANILKANIIRELMLRIAELNSNPEYFDNDLLYYGLIDEVLEKILNNLPTSCDFKGSIPARKYQFKEMLMAIKPLVKHEKERYLYKQKLKHLIADVLKEPLNATQDKIELLNDIKEEILEHFLLYRYNTDPEARQMCKNNVHDVLARYIAEVKDRNVEESDPLILKNFLLCELSKISISENILRQIVEEVKMKQEVDEFFQDIPISKEKLALSKQMKANLSKSLKDIERSGYNCSNNEKMKTEINKCLGKLNVRVKPGAVETFITKLKATEMSRKLSDPVPQPIHCQTRNLFRPGTASNSSMSAQWNSVRTNGGPSATPQLSQPFPSIRPNVILEKSGQTCHQDVQSSCRAQHNSSPRQVVQNINPASQSSGPTQPAEASIPMLDLLNRMKSDAPVGQNPPEDWYRQREDYVFHDTFVPKSGYNRYRSQVESMVDRSLGASDVTYDNFRGGTFPKSSLDMSKMQSNPPQLSDYVSMPYEPIHVSAVTPYLPQEPSGSVTPSSLLLQPDFSDMGSLSQYGAAEIAQLVSQMQPNFDEAAQNARTGDPRANAVIPDEAVGVNDVDGACVCIKNVLRNFKGEAFCVPPMDDYCADCGGFGPMWWAMCPCCMFY